MPGTWMITAKGRNKTHCDDVVLFRSVDGGTVLCLADGATGVGDGRFASAAVAEAAVSVSLDSLLQPGGLAAHLFAAEVAIITGEHDSDTTAILALSAGAVVHGCSVGDSQAWLLDPDGGPPDCLTARQNPRPRVGAGCRPVTWEPRPLEGRLLLMASDCLFDWLAIRDIAGAVSVIEPCELVARLHDAVLATCGYMPDDFSAICHQS